ncbi:indole-3-glycerol phosphate synthase TrpC [Ornithobacterium rhinotracheale]|uniref:indole-3-glycerol phosphate synthase TrpC n=1 Tax=Ornithobacterium rhinotracheale TaxID=28251 RepID=UPI004035635B
MSILDKIVAHKKEEIEFEKRRISVEELMDRKHFHRKSMNFAWHLKENPFGIIAEFKRKSPSKSDINIGAKVEDIVPIYKACGAACVSVLTDSHFFGGSLEDLKNARKYGLPLLRKDFILDPYQLYQAKAFGADAVLLIANILERNQIKDLTDYAKDLGLQVLLEFYGGEDFSKYYNKVKMVGINNRNLNTFEVDYQHAIRMRNELPTEVLSVAESAIYSPEIYLELKKNGFDAFLMGEYFMKTNQPEETFKNFIQVIQP